jgi:hypothetical protein
MKRALFSIGMTSVLLICLGWSGNAAAQGPPVDDGTTLIFLLKPGADMTRVGNIISGAGGTVLKSTTIHTGQRILKVQVPAGTSADAEKSIGAMADPDIAVGRNYYLQLQNQGPQICSPNDPDFPQQWALPDMNYPAALCRARPTRIPAMTYIDSGVNPVFPFELALIQQLNFANGADGKREFPFDADTNGNGYHGTSTSGTGGATTNDHEFIAGVASVREPVFITMLRVADPPGTTITSADLVDAFAWCLDHQLERGGPGPINVSINSPPPDTLNTFPPLQALSQSLEAQGDLVVNGAGNTGTDDSSPDSVGIRRVAGTDENNQLADFSTYGPFFTAAAPATNILVFGAPTGGIGSPPSLVFVNGTSQSTAYWSGSIAFLMAACHNRLNAPQADAIIFNTATITSATGPLELRYHIPNLNNALNHCQ